MPLTAVAHACETVSVATVDVTSVEVDPATATLVVNEVGNLAVTARAASGSVLRGRSVSWTSLDPEVATVDADGVVYAVAAGTATIQASVDGVTGTASITVAAPSALQLSEDTLTFVAPFGGGPTPATSVAVRASDASTISGLSATVAAQDPGTWLEHELSSTSTPATLDVRALPAGLAEGLYRATITLTGVGTGVVPALLEVTLRVGAAPPEISAAPSSLSLAADQGQSSPPPHPIEIRNSGGGTLSGLRFTVDYTTGSASDWLVPSLDRTSAPAVLSVGVNTVGLLPGVYDAVIEIEAASAPGASAWVQVRFRYGEPPPEIELDSRELTWDVPEGSLTIATQTVTIENRGSGVLGSLSTQVRYASTGPVGWLNAGVNPTVAPATLHVSVVDGGLQPGEYRATVDVRSPSAINSPQSVAVTVRVRPRPSPERSTITAAPTSIPADGTSTATITVRLNDANGNPVTSGGHVVLMTTTAGSLGPVQAAGGGVFTAQLTSPKAGGSATVSASVDGRPLTRSASVSFVTGPPSPTASTLTAAPTSIIANGTSTSTITLQLRDANGNPTAAPQNATVTFVTTAGSIGPVTNPATGVYVVALRSATAVGIANVTARLGGTAFGGPVSVAFVAGPAAGVRLTGPATGTILIPTAPLTLTIVDASGNPTTSPSAERFTLSNSGQPGVFLPQSPITIPAGSQSATLTFTGIQNNGTRTITATWTSGGPIPLGSASHEIRY